LLSKPSVAGIEFARCGNVSGLSVGMCLGGDIEVLQQELFPLCLMLYPTLNVSWELVRQMLHLMGREFMLN
jgi:hypothetical protein